MAKKTSASKKFKDINQQFLEERLHQFLAEKDVTTYAAEQAKYKLEVIKRYEPNANDEKLGLKFRNIVIEHKRKNPGDVTFFKFDFIDKLGLGDLNVLLVYAGKNIGKTYALGELATKTLYDDPKSKIAYIRTLQDDLKKGFSAQNMESNGPGTGSPTTGQLTLKKGHFIETDGRRPEGDVVGIAAHLSGRGTQSMQGAGFEGLRYIMWDECNDCGGLTEHMLNAFLIYCLSLERMNKGLQLIMTGNLLAKDDGIVNNQLLDMFGIPINTKLKYVEIPRKNKAPFKFLYINTGRPGELFEGSEDQDFNCLLQIAGKLYLVDNEPQDITLKTVTMSNFLAGKPVFAFVKHVNYQEERADWVTYISKVLVNLEGRQKPYYIVHCEPYKPKYPYEGFKLFTDDYDCGNDHYKIKVMKEEKFAKVYSMIEKMLKARRIFYSSSVTRDVFRHHIWKHLKSHYAPMLEDPKKMSM